MKLKKAIKVGAEIVRNLFRRALTVRFPEESLDILTGYRGEHKFKKDKCIGCGSCARICPNNAIEMVEDEKGKTYPKIDLSRCCYCSLCEEVCPVDAIKLTKNLPESTHDPSSLVKDPRSRGEEEKNPDQ